MNRAISSSFTIASVFGLILRAFSFNRRKLVKHSGAKNWSVFFNVTCGTKKSEPRRSFTAQPKYLYVTCRLRICNDRGLMATTFLYHYFFSSYAPCWYLGASSCVDKYNIIAGSQKRIHYIFTLMRTFFYFIIFIYFFDGLQCVGLTLLMLPICDFFVRNVWI